MKTVNGKLVQSPQPDKFNDQLHDSVTTFCCQPLNETNEPWEFVFALSETRNLQKKTIFPLPQRIVQKSQRSRVISSSKCKLRPQLARPAGFITHSVSSYCPLEKQLLVPAVSKGYAVTQRRGLADVDHLRTGTIACPQPLG